MLAPMLAVLSTIFPAAALASPRAAAPPVPSTGRVSAPEGISFQLPPRFAYSVRDDGGRRVYVAAGADGGTVVTVSAFRSDSELPCSGGDLEGVDVVPFRTSAGLDGCRIGAAAEDTPGAMSISFVRAGETFVSVMSIAPADGEAERLGRLVAESVRIGRARSGPGPARLNVPRADPRLVGCFDDSQSAAVGRTTGIVVRKRCFSEDFTFSETADVAVSTSHEDLRGDFDGTSTATRKGSVVRGTWMLDGEDLALAYDDGGEAHWTLYFSDESVLANDRLWTRR